MARCFTKRCILGFLLSIYLILLVFALFNYNSKVRVTMPDIFSDKLNMVHLETFNLSGSKTSEQLRKPFCQLKWDDLNYHYLDILESPSMQSVNSLYPMVEQGGSWSPKDCQTLQDVAIVIPYRNRWHHLKLLMKRLHYMLQMQKISYSIYVVEQVGELPFNRGLLMNIGFATIMKEKHFDCVIFHDVDLLPEHDRNIYLCDDHVRHLASAIDEMRYHVMYFNYAGGVVGLSSENMVKINGYSNSYWGWGNEDDDFRARTREIGLDVTRPPDYIGRYKMIRHAKASHADHGNDYFLQWRGRWKRDGLNSLKDIDYKVTHRIENPLYTNLTIDVGEKPQRVPSETKESIWWFLTFYFP